MGGLVIPSVDCLPNLTLSVVILLVGLETSFFGGNFTTMSSKQDLINLAKSCEEMERYEKMAKVSGGAITFVEMLYLELHFEVCKRKQL